MRVDFPKLRLKLQTMGCVLSLRLALAPVVMVMVMVMVMGLLLGAPSLAWSQVGIETDAGPLLNELTSKTKVPAPQVDVRTVDPQGRVQSWTAKVSARMLWLSTSSRSPERGQPGVEIEWESLKGLGGRSGGSSAEFKPERFTGLEIDRKVSDGNSLKLNLKTDRTLTQVVTKEVAVFFTVRSAGTFVDIDSECEELGIRLTRLSKLPHELLYLGARCEAVDDKGVEVTLFVPSDSSLKKTPLLSKAKLGPGWVKIFVGSDQLRSKAPRVLLGDIQLAGSETKLSFYRDRVKNQSLLSALKRWSLNWGLGLSYLNYTELPDNEKIQTMALTGKLAGSAQLIPGRLDLGASTFLNLVPFRISASPADLDPKRFFGVNLRLGYTLPLDPRAVQWSVSLGSYIWGMLGSDNRYGVSMLTGPQIYVVARKSLPRARGWFGYFKFAPVGGSLSTLTLGNRELAVGGGWSWKQWGRTVGVTLDVSNLNFQLLDAENKIYLDSASLGFQFSF